MLVPLDLDYFMNLEMIPALVASTWDNLREKQQKKKRLVSSYDSNTPYSLSTGKIKIGDDEKKQNLAK